MSFESSAVTAPASSSSSSSSPTYTRFIGPDSALVRTLIEVVGRLSPLNRATPLFEELAEKNKVPERFRKETTLALQAYEVHPLAESLPVPGPVLGPEFQGAVEGFESITSTLLSEDEEKEILKIAADLATHVATRPSVFWRKVRVENRDVLFVATGVYVYEGVTTNWNGKLKDTTINKVSRLLRDKNGERLSHMAQGPGPNGKGKATVWIWALDYKVGDEYVFWVNRNGRDVSRLRVTLTPEGTLLSNVDLKVDPWGRCL